MWLLGQRCGKTWWQKQNDVGDWVPVTDEEAAASKKYWNDKRDEIAAKIFNDAFNKETSK